MKCRVGQLCACWSTKKSEVAVRESRRVRTRESMSPNPFSERSSKSRAAKESI